MKLMQILQILERNFDLFMSGTGLDSLVRDLGVRSEINDEIDMKV